MRNLRASVGYEGYNDPTLRGEAFNLRGIAERLAQLAGCKVQSGPEPSMALFEANREDRKSFPWLILCSSREIVLSVIGNFLLLGCV